MKPLRVLHIYRTYFPETQGGLQEAIRQICHATGPLGVDNRIFCLARQPDPAELRRDEGTVLRAKSWLAPASCDLGAWAAFARCRRAADDSDVIQIHYPWPFADVLLPFIRRRGQPVVVTYHSDIVRQGSLDKLYAPLRRYLLNTASRIVATSPPYARTSPILQAYADKVASIPLCLAEGPAPDPERVAHWRERLGSDFFLFVGVTRYYKGLHFLLQAAREVASPIVIVGDGPERPGLEEQARLAGLAHVHFLGALPDEDKFALYALCRGVVFPSHLRSEAFGVTLLEGARAGKPLISCEIGTGTSWVNQQGQTGLVIPPADPAALAGAMNRLAGDDALCRQLGEGARERWQHCLTPGVVGIAYRRLYDEVLAGQEEISLQREAG